MNNKQLILIDKVVGLVLLPCSLVFRAITLFRRSSDHQDNQPILIHTGIVERIFKINFHPKLFPHFRVAGQVICRVWIMLLPLRLLRIGLFLSCSGMVCKSRRLKIFRVLFRAELNLLHPEYKMATS